MPVASQITRRVPIQEKFCLRSQSMKSSISSLSRTVPGGSFMVASQYSKPALGLFGLTGSAFGSYPGLDGREPNSAL